MRSTGHAPSNELFAGCVEETGETKVPRGATSPLTKIPREILCEIFLYANDSKFPLIIPLRQSRLFPWTLSQVCSHWRDTLFRIPGLWDTVKIRDDVYDAEIPGIVSIFRMMLSRSTAQISLIAPHNDQLFTNLVIPNLTRLKGLETILGQDSFQTFIELPRGSVNSLASINLHFAPGDLPYIRSNAFQTSPNLREVTFTNHRGKREWPLGLWLLPWAQLTTITLPTSIIPIPTLHTFLAQCTCLRAATLVIGDDTLKLADLLRTEIIVPMLESLVLHAYGETPNWEAFLHPLVLPSFQSITVLDSQTWSQAGFTSLVVRSSCPLKSLFMVYYRDTTHDLHSLLKHTPSLHSLILPWLHIPASIFEAMRQRQLLPVLRHLECIVDPDGLSAVLDLVESYPSGKPVTGAPNGGIQLGSFICAHDEDDEDDEDGFDDALERYNSLQPTFLLSLETSQCTVISESTNTYCSSTRPANLSLLSPVLDVVTRPSGWCWGWTDLLADTTIYNLDSCVAYCRWKLGSL